MKKSAVVAVVVLCFVLMSSRPADTCGPFFSTLVFARKHGPDKPLSAFVAGRVGIVRPTWYRAYLVLAYRQLSGKPLTAAEQKSVLGMWGVNGPTVASENAVDEWLKTRSEFTKNAVPSEVKQYREGFEFSSYVNCAPPAFRTAAATLRERAAKYKSAGDELEEWIRGQDAVFQNCGDKGGVIPATLHGDYSKLLRADRAYQVAAAHFYSADFEEAEQEFTAIAADKESPWREIAPYLAARSVLRSGVVIRSDSDGPDFRRPEMERAEKMFKGIIADSSAKALHRDAERSLAFIEFRIHPNERRLELAKIIASGRSGANLGQDLRDYTLLLDKVMDEKPDFEGTQRWGKEYEKKLADWNARRYEEMGKELRSDLTDWVITMQEASPQAAKRALAKWRATKSEWWLVAALSSAGADDENSKELLSASANIDANSAAYATVVYHRARLMNGVKEFGQSRKILDEALTHSATLPVSAVNLLKDERMKAAATVEEFAALVARKPVEFEDDENLWSSTDDSDGGSCTGGNACESVFYGKAKKKGEVQQLLPQFDSDAARTLNVDVPISTLVAVSGSERMPTNLRRRLVLASWTRAVLLDDQAAAAKLTDAAVSAEPGLRSFADAYLKASTAEERNFAGVFAILHFPGLRPFVEGTTPRTTSLGKIDSYSDNWWCDATGKAGRWYRATDNGNADPNGSDAIGFLSAEDTKAVEAESDRLSSIDAGATYLPRAVIKWAKAHKNDARVPEALHLSVRATRYGCFQGDKNAYSREAFMMLHKNYPRSEWAKKTPYWFH